MRRAFGPLRIGLEFLAVAAALAIFVGPLLFILFTAGKNSQEAAAMNLSLPAHPQYWKNIVAVVQASNYMLVRAFVNSLILTVSSMAILVFVSSMAGFVMERRRGKFIAPAHFLILVGLMLPPSVITTIWVLQGLALYKTLAGLILVEVALGFPFAVLLYRAFMVTVPRELDEAALMEGASSGQLFFRIIFPLLQPVSATVIVLSSVNVFNDFVNPLYFLPGAKNATIQLTLYNFLSRY
ncbi:MAG TPA: carbohydrate ABC transporter permease [Rectinemataceae bacterium]|nr:carbohydrate ABC transporter permease [Rectinemataceae bacterium]